MSRKQKRIVKIEIEVELSDWTAYVAVDADGSVFEYEKMPKKHRNFCIKEFYGDGIGVSWDIRDESDFYSRLKIKNWKKTLTKVE